MGLGLTIGSTGAWMVLWSKRPGQLLAGGLRLRISGQTRVRTLDVTNDCTSRQKGKMERIHWNGRHQRRRIRLIFISPDAQGCPRLAVTGSNPLYIGTRGNSHSTNGKQFSACSKPVKVSAAWEPPTVRPKQQ